MAYSSVAMCNPSELSLGGRPGSQRGHDLIRAQPRVRQKSEVDHGGGVSVTTRSRPYRSRSEARIRAAPSTRSESDRPTPVLTRAWPSGQNCESAIPNPVDLPSRRATLCSPAGSTRSGSPAGSVANISPLWRRPPRPWARATGHKGPTRMRNAAGADATVHISDLLAGRASGPSDRHARPDRRPPLIGRRIGTNATSRRRHDGVRCAPEPIRSGRSGAGLGWGGAGTLPRRPQDSKHEALKHHQNNLVAPTGHEPFCTLIFRGVIRAA
jgi:hypothetical protein